MIDPEFDLEREISDWRSSLCLRRTFLQDDLDELEDHLRREIARRIDAGLSPVRAFRLASTGLGSSMELESVYEPLRFGKVKRFRNLTRDAAFGISMFGHYVGLAFRSFRRNKTHSLINVSGLAVALVACLLIGLYVQDELSYDRFHSRSEQIYRVRTGSEGNWNSLVKASVAETLVREFGQIRSAVRLFKHWEQPLIARSREGGMESHFYFADSTFLDVFSFELLSGNRSTALSAPHSVLITESAARRYFGDDDPVGKSLNYNTRHQLTVTGVLADVPKNSHIHPEFVASLSTLPSVSYSRILDDWAVFYTYLEVLPGAAPGEFITNAEASMDLGAAAGPRSRLDFQPLTDIHLYSQMSNELEINGDIRYVILMASIGFLILLIACINHMNLATATAMRRAKEVAVRKVAGAQRSEVIQQFYVEAAVLVFVSLVLSGFLMVLLEPYFSGLIGKSLLEESISAEVLISGVVLAVLVAILAGTYPAFFLSRYRPAVVLKGSFISSAKGKRLRNVLVLSQFTASAVLIVITLMVSRQLQFVEDTELGFRSENVLTVPVQGMEARSRYQTLRAAWLDIGSVTAVGATASSYPGLPHSAGHYLGHAGDQESETRSVQRNWADAHYFDALGIEILSGRLFSENPAANERSIILNESAARLMGWSDPALAASEPIYLNPASDPEGYEIIGVVKDYNFESLHSGIGPLVFTPAEFPTRMVVRARGGGMDETLRHMTTAWDEIIGQPFSYAFLDDQLEELYGAEKRWAGILRVATLLALFIAALGLLGLATFVAETRIREIGIRKALGATAAGIVVLVSQDFVKLILIAAAIATPISYLAVDQWLSSFAYRTTIGWGVFVWGALILLAIGVATVGFHAAKTAMARPAHSLRND